MFVCGWYNVKLFNKAGEVVESKEMYLTFPLYRREVANAQLSALNGKDLAEIVIEPIEKK